jgi:glucose dehydrogenase
VTAAGVTLIGDAMDGYLRAYDSETGEERFRHQFPAPGHATPMTFRPRPDSR